MVKVHSVVHAIGAESIELGRENYDKLLLRRASERSVNQPETRRASGYDARAGRVRCIVRESTEKNVSGIAE